MKTKIKKAVKTGLIGGLLSLVISALLNYYVFPMPISVLDNTIGHGIGGFFCGFISAFFGVLVILIELKSDEKLYAGSGF